MILADRRRFVTGTLGIGLAVALILLLQGLWGGVLEGVSAYPDRVGADLFVREPRAQNLVGGTVPLTAVRQIRGLPGVRRADPVLARYVILSLHDAKEPVTVVASQPGGLGGAWRIVEGRAVSGPGEVVLDRTLASSHGIPVRGYLPIQGTRFRVVGLSDRTRTLIGGGFAFLTLPAAQRLFGQPQSATFILVRTDTPGSVANAVRLRTGLTGDPASTVAGDQREVFGRALGKIFNLLILIAFAAGTLIVALTVYSTVIDRLPDYGVIKAMGADRRRIFRVVAGQTLTLSVAGTLTGLALFVVVSRLLIVFKPQDATSLTLGALTSVLLAAAGMALLAAALPTRRVARLDPASVYRR